MLLENPKEYIQEAKDTFIWLEDTEEGLKIFAKTPTREIQEIGLFVREGFRNLVKTDLDPRRGHDRNHPDDLGKGFTYSCVEPDSETNVLVRLEENSRSSNKVGVTGKGLVLFYLQVRNPGDQPGQLIEIDAQTGVGSSRRIRGFPCGPGSFYRFIP